MTTYNEKVFRETQKHKRRMRKMGFNPDVIRKYELLQNIAVLGKSYAEIESQNKVNKLLIKDMLIRAVLEQI